MTNGASYETVATTVNISKTNKDDAIHFADYLYTAKEFVNFQNMISFNNSNHKFMIRC